MLFELELLDFLRERGVRAAAPLRRNDGALLGWTATPAGQRATSLFEVAPGDPPENPPLPTQARELGKAVAELHLAANDFSSPHERYHLDLKYLVEQPLELIGQRDDKNLQEALAALQPVEAMVDHVTALSTDADEYGVIHGDMHFGNMHFDGDRVTLFDFDHCAYGWRAYDLVAALFLPEAQQNAFFEGYESLRPLSTEERDSIPVFAKLRTLWDMGDMMATESLRMDEGS